MKRERMNGGQRKGAHGSHRFWMLALALGTLFGCTAPGEERVEVSVLVRSNLSAESDFAQVVTQVANKYGGGFQRETMSVSRGMDFSQGVVVTRREDLKRGVYYLRVNLIDGGGRLVAFADRLVNATGDFQAVVELNRMSCDNVVCGEGDACINGDCIASTCITNPGASNCGPKQDTQEPPSGLGTLDGGMEPPDPPPGSCTDGQTTSCSVNSCIGQASCLVNTWGQCQVSTSAETCDGQDNDC
ncbi:MAG: hypothetical protein KC417_17060, partial [Myxococcales bacterium]|nr:hypothetical protein [Myxococcales bacterium]